ncbi:MAG: AMP-binding protein, partial [Candidatus Odinarchaeota archaeon]
MLENNPYTGKPWINHYDKGLPASINYPEMNIYEFLDNSAKEFGDRTAIWFIKEKISYEKLKDFTDRLATALVNIGVKKGDLIAIMMPNFPQFIISYYGILKAGGIITSLSILSTERELTYQLNDAGAKILIVWDKYINRIDNIMEKTCLNQIIFTNLFDFASKVNPLGDSEPPKIAKSLQFLNLINNTKPAPPKFQTKAKEDLVCLQYTPGTTGLPKGVMLTHYNITSNVIAINQWLGSRMRRGKETILTCLPFDHIYAQIVSMNLHIYNGSTIALLLEPGNERILFATFKETHPTFFPGVPSMFMRLIDRENLEGFLKDLKSLKVCNIGAAAIPLKVLKEFEKRTVSILLEGYGMTETSALVMSNPIAGKRKIGSVGLPYPDVEVKLVDVEDYTKIVPQGEYGEIMIKGPQVFKGYWNNPEVNANQLKDGWILTGDIATMDEDGYFHIIERKNYIIKMNGYKVFPREIEDLLFKNEIIEKVAVIGIPDPEDLASEEVKAFILLKYGYKVTEEIKTKIKNFCSKNLATYKVPKIYEFRRDLSKSVVGKEIRKDWNFQNLW